MSSFEYVTVMVSVVLALGFSHILGSIGSIIANPGSVTRYGLHFLWTFLLLLLHFQFWLALWALRAVEAWPVARIAGFLVGAALLFVASRVLVPELRNGAPIDLREHFLRVRLPLFSIFALFWLVPIISRKAYMGGSYFEQPIVSWLVFFALSISGAIVKQEAWHAGIALAWLALFVRYFIFVSRGVAA